MPLLTGIEVLAVAKCPAVLEGRKSFDERGGESMSMTMAEGRTQGGVEVDWRRSGMVYADGTGSDL